MSSDTSAIGLPAATCPRRSVRPPWNEWDARHGRHGRATGPHRRTRALPKASLFASVAQRARLASSHRPLGRACGQTSFCPPSRLMQLRAQARCALTNSGQHTYRADRGPTASARASQGCRQTHVCGGSRAARRTAAPCCPTGPDVSRTLLTATAPSVIEPLIQHTAGPGWCVNMKTGVSGR